jgi:PIN domain nuclease of toxin-antitoxin system
MRILLDTHTLIWWHQDNKKLSAQALSAIVDPANTVYLSVASAWEMQIKTQLGNPSPNRYCLWNDLDLTTEITEQAQRARKGFPPTRRPVPLRSKA